MLTPMTPATANTTTPMPASTRRHVRAPTMPPSAKPIAAKAAAIQCHTKVGTASPNTFVAFTIL